MLEKQEFEQIIKREEIENIKLSDEILQPKLNFKSEV